MKTLQLSIFAALVVGVSRTALAQAPAREPPPLPKWTEYVTRQDDVSKWTVTVRGATDGTKYCEAKLISQDWGGPWEHMVRMVSPAKTSSDDLAVISLNPWNELGTPLDAARAFGLPYVTVNIHPSKIFGLSPDDGFFAYAKQLLDRNEPAFAPTAPMCRAAVRTMDCVQQESTPQFGRPIKRFILVGHSRSGVTAW